MARSQLFTKTPAALQLAMQLWQGEIDRTAVSPKDIDRRSTPATYAAAAEYRVELLLAALQKEGQQLYAVVTVWEHAMRSGFGVAVITDYDSFRGVFKIVSRLALDAAEHELRFFAAAEGLLS